MELRVFPIPFSGENKREKFRKLCRSGAKSAPSYARLAEKSIELKALVTFQETYADCNANARLSEKIALIYFDYMRTTGFTVKYLQLYLIKFTCQP